MPSKSLIALALAAVGFLAWLGFVRQPKHDTATDVREREVIHQTDTAYRTRVDTLTRVRILTDSVLRTDTVFKRDTVVKWLAAERNACNAIVSACEARVEARDQRIRTLEHRLGGTLFLYGEAGVEFPKGVPVGARFVGEAGAAVRLDRDLFLQAAATSDRDLRIKVHKNLKLF